MNTIRHCEKCGQVMFPSDHFQRQLATAMEQRDKAVETLEEIREVWAGAEVGVPHYAQEAYAINLCKQMYSLAVGSLKECEK